MAKTNAEHQALWRARRGAELQQLRQEVAQLRAEVAELRARPARGDPVTRAAPDAETAATLPKTAKARFDRLVEKERAALNAEFDARVQAAVCARVDAAVAAERERLAELRKEYMEEKKWLAVRERRLNAWMGMDEFRLVQRCLHPDLQPEDMKDRYTRAFAIFKRLETYMDPSKEPKRENPFKRKGA